MPPAQQNQNKNQDHQRQEIGKKGKVHRDPGIVALGFDLNPRPRGMRLLPLGDRTSAVTTSRETLNQNNSPQSTISAMAN
jgi:hypothetical protein